MRKIFFLSLLLCGAAAAHGQMTDSTITTQTAAVATDSAKTRTIHRISIEVRPLRVVPTHRFLTGDNLHGIPIDRGISWHLKYSFQRPDHRWAPTAYQGIGVSHHRFFYARTPQLPFDWESRPGDRTSAELGTPTAVYLFQGARIARLGSRFSLNYEWDFGLSFGWEPYHSPENQYNKVIGARVNAYLNANLYLLWRLTRTLELTAGASAMHFSNGSTRLPNAGLNTLGATVGATVNLGRPRNFDPRPAPDTLFRQHMSYEVVVFGAWRKKGIPVEDIVYGSPHNYSVWGFNFAAMYNLGHKVRLGGSLDGVYDGSANAYIDFPTDGGELHNEHFKTPSFHKQWALGVAAQVDYVMPIFTVTLGFGANVLHGGGELDSFYQKLALKIHVAPRAFLNIGYSLREFRAPNFLMLGVGYRFG